MAPIALPADDLVEVAALEVVEALDPVVRLAVVEAPKLLD